MWKKRSMKIPKWKRIKAAIYKDLIALGNLEYNDHNLDKVIAVMEKHLGISDKYTTLICLIEGHEHMFDTYCKLKAGKQ